MYVAAKIHNGFKILKADLDFGPAGVGRASGEGLGRSRGSPRSADPTAGNTEARSWILC